MTSFRSALLASLEVAQCPAPTHDVVQLGGVQHRLLRVEHALQRACPQDERLQRADGAAPVFESPFGFMFVAMRWRLTVPSVHGRGNGGKAQNGGTTTALRAGANPRLTSTLAACGGGSAAGAPPSPAASAGVAGFRGSKFRGLGGSVDAQCGHDPCRCCVRAS